MVGKTKTGGTAPQNTIDALALLETVLGSTHAMICAWDAARGEMVYLSPAAQEAFGSIAEADGMFVNSKDNAQLLETVKAQGHADEIRMVLGRNDDGRFKSLASGRLTQHEDRDLIVVTYTNVTHWSASEELIGQILEAYPTPIQMLRAESGEILFSSPQTKALFGDVASSKQFYAKPSDRAAFITALRNKGWLSEYKIQLKNALGELFWASVSARLITYMDEEVIVSHTHDMTAQLDLEDALAEQREHVAHNERMSALSDLLAEVAHELNNPLSVVIGHALMLREDNCDPEVERQAHKISVSAERCARIVKTFVSLARQQPARVIDTDLNDLVVRAADAIDPELVGTIKIVRALGKSMPRVDVDAGQILQVLDRLIENAIEAIQRADSKGTITLTTAIDTENDIASILIDDDGPGVPDELATRIFGPFFSTKDTSEGRGLGLAFSHQVIESHKGQLRLEKKQGTGARFRIDLPTQSRLVPDARGSEATGDQTVGRRIMVVDDEVDVAEITAEILQRDGFTVELVTRSDEALALLESQKFDVILSDLNMPNIDGRGFYERIVEEFPDLVARLGFVTGDTMGQQSQSFLREAGRPYLEKPVSPAELRQFVEHILKKKKADA